MQPFLLDGFKLDLRVYVLVTACNPLRIFIYKDGLVRDFFFFTVVDLQLLHAELPMGQTCYVYMYNSLYWIPSNFLCVNIVTIQSFTAEFIFHAYICIVGEVVDSRVHAAN